MKHQASKLDHLSYSYFQCKFEFSLIPQDRDLYNYVTIKVTGKPLQKGRTTLPVMSTVTENEQVFQAVQIIPGVGIRCYFAASMLPIKHWFKSCAFHMPPSTDVRTVDEAVNTFTDFIRVQMKR